MKKCFFVIVAAVAVSVILCACSSSETTDYDYNTTDSYDDVYNYTYDSYEDDYLSESEAEQIALEYLYWWLECCFRSDYDISATRYSVGSITGSGSSGYTVYGKYYLYDKYGDMARARNFSVKVQSDGSVSTDDIDLFAD